MNRLFLLIGLALTVAAVRADMRGWLGARPSIVNNVPASMRDNPGAYRALYAASPRTIGGK